MFQRTLGRSLAQFYKPNETDDKWQFNSDHQNVGQAKGYLRNVALKVLLLNTRWPFVFAKDQSRQKKSLLDTLFIGFDVLNEIAGFTFLGDGGRICFFRAVDSLNKAPQCL